MGNIPGVIKCINRNSTILSSSHLKVYSDKIRLPNGQVIKDYTVIEKPSGVIIVATDKNNNLIYLKEYKYAVDKILLTLPAGKIEDNLSIIDNAKKELLEETGYMGNDFKEIITLYEYPTKDLHKSYVVRAKNVIKVASPSHEPTEEIEVIVKPIAKIKNQIKLGKWKIGVVVAALVLTDIL